MQTKMKDRYEELKKQAYLDAGLYFWDVDEDGVDEYVGTMERWQKAEKLLEQYLDNG